MNNIFVKNLTALSQKNPKLVEKLKSFIPTEVPQLVQSNNAYNILYKNILIHNENNPLGEAQEIFSMAENSPTSIHLIYGIGLGYLFQIASLNSKGIVILYETDLNLLWLAFTLVDFSSEILKQNIFITNDFDEMAQIVYRFSNTQNTPTILSLPAIRKLEGDNFHNFVKTFQDVVGAFSLDLKYTKEKFYPSLKMLIQNIPHLFNEIPLINLQNIYNGKTAVVVSAGPTLDRNIENLKRYRDKYILFTVGTAAKTLYANGIKPDFLCIIETHNASKQIEGLDLSSVNFITEPFSNPALRKFKFKNIFLHSASNNPINQFWSEIFSQEINEYLSKGTVSYTALNSARILGFSKIILVGQDLAYVEGQCYSKDSAYKDLICQYNKETNKWEITTKDFDEFASAISASEDPNTRKLVAENRLKNLNNSLYYVKGISGEMIPTESVYATFVKPLESYAQEFQNKHKFINTSLIGAQINGFENMPLEEALKNEESIKSIDIKNEFKHNQELIVNNLKEKLFELKSITTHLEKGFKLTKNLNNDLKKFRYINQDILKLLKKVCINYMYLSNDFSQKSKLFNFIISSDKIDLDFLMKNTQDFSLENVVKINQKLASFYTSTEKKISEIEVLINESINSAS